MDVKSAVHIAAEYVADMEQLTALRSDRNEEEEFRFLGGIDFAVEGTRFDEDKNAWVIEVGFTRPWDRAKPNPLSGLSNALQDRRTIKKVVVSDENGKVISYGG